MVYLVLTGVEFNTEENTLTSRDDTTATCPENEEEILILNAFHPILQVEALTLALHPMAHE